ncbi:MAG: type II toxin-antitoxin system VapC family toxin [Acidithiobacillales bacterium]
MIVLDASAVLEFLLRTPIGLKVARRIAPADETLHAPHLIDLEVAQVLRRREASRTLSHSRAEQALADFSDLDMARYPHDVLLPRIWALRKNVTAYDAAYLALAEALEAPLLTTDAKLARASGHRTRVEVVATA